MKTLYIDVYFLINFTVDLLALHFASRFTKIAIKTVRMILGAAFGALFACMMVLIDSKPIISLSISLVILLLTSYVLISKTTLVRRIKLCIAFFLFLVIIGGIVYFAFCTLDRYFPEQLPTQLHNHSLLVFSLILLLAIAVIKLVLNMFLSSGSEKIVKLIIELSGNRVECDALVDTGNLLKDPLDSTPVMLLKESSAKRLFTSGIPRLYDSKVPKGLERHLRVVPISKEGKKNVVLGIRPERVRVVANDRCEDIRITVIIDEEGGTFAGCEALMPAAAIENI